MRISDWSSDVCSSDLFDLLTGENRYKGTELGRKEIRTIRNKAEQTMIDVNKPVRTRDGCNARIVATDLRNRNGDTILALITPPDAPYEFPRSYQPDGDRKSTRLNSSH